MSIKISALREEIKSLQEQLHDSEILRGAQLVEAGCDLDKEKDRFKPLFILWGKEYGWRKTTGG